MDSTTKTIKTKSLQNLYRFGDKEVTIISKYVENPQTPALYLTQKERYIKIGFALTEFNIKIEPQAPSLHFVSRDNILRKLPEKV